MAKKPLTLKQFTESVELLIKTRFGLELNDCTDEDRINAVYSSGTETPSEYVDWLQQRHDLTDITTSPYYGRVF